LKSVSSKQQQDSDDDIDDDSGKNHTLARMWIQMIPMMTTMFCFHLSNRENKQDERSNCTEKEVQIPPNSPGFPQILSDFPKFSVILPDSTKFSQILPDSP
jgi:hypothetical protein